MAQEADIKRLTNENRDQQKLLQQFDEKECAYKENIVTLIPQLKEGKKIEEGMRKQYKEREYECQSLEDKVASLRNKLQNLQEEKINEEDEIIKVIIERTNYCEGLEVEIISIKFDLEKSTKRYEEILHVFQEQENALKGGIIELRNPLEKKKGEKEVEVIII